MTRVGTAIEEERFHPRLTESKVLLATVRERTSELETALTLATVLIADRRQSKRDYVSWTMLSNAGARFRS